MKLDKIKFASVILFIARRLNIDYMNSEFIEELDRMIDVPIPAVEAPVYANGTAISQLMMLMQEGSRKIEAIKMHRSITGYGLKESKDEVDRYWPVVKPAPITKAEANNLGDILKQASSFKD